MRSVFVSIALILIVAAIAAVSALIANHFAAPASDDVGFSFERTMNTPFELLPTPLPPEPDPVPTPSAH